MIIELVNTKSDEAVYSYDTDTHEVEILSDILTDIMKNTGIPIPPGEVADEESIFYGKRRVTLEDGDQYQFHEAFRQHYFPSNYDRNQYKWKVR